MTMKIGPWTLEGTDAQNAILQPMAEKAAVVLALEDGTSRVKPARVLVKPRNQMPWADDEETVRSRGYWNGRDVFLADDLFPSPDLARKTFAHELVHQLNDQWMLRSQERDIKPLFKNPPIGFPAEPFAVYGSAAIFGFTNPPYQNYYKSNSIPATNWPKLKEIALRDDHVDPCQQYIDQIAALVVDKANLAADLAACQVALTDCEIRVTAKDQKMTEGLEV